MTARRRVLPAIGAVAVACLVGATLPSAGLAAVGAPATRAPQAVPARGAAPPAVALAREHAVVQKKNGRFGPYGANPSTSLVPRPDQQDRGGWRRAQQSAAAKQAAARRATARQAASTKARAAAVAPRFIREDEPAGIRGSNDTFGSAQRLPGVGTTRGSNPAATILGRLSPAAVPPLETLPPNVEDDGTFETARDTGVSEERGGFRTTGTIGDNPPNPDFPGETDADIYELNLRAGELVDVRYSRTSGDLLTAAFLVEADGPFFAFSDDDFEGNSTLSTTVRTAGTYYLILLGYTIFDFDTGAEIQTKGGYTVSITARAGDRDLYAVRLQAGDVLGVSVTDAASYVSVFDAAGTEVHGSPYDASYIYPLDNPLPGGGNAVTDHVARTGGLHYVEVTGGSGTYEAGVEIYRYGGAARKQSQTIYLDTDGQRLNTGIFGGRGVTTLSPLRAFLGRWGLTAAQERALVQRLKANVQENLDADLRASGLSRSVDVKVVTKYDGPDPFGKPGVTRIVVGGTIEESGVPTIGIAQSIDPGNFEREETGLVLLDSLSEPGSADEAPYSLNTYLTPRSDRLRFVGQAVGNVISHEVGHMIGNWHVDSTNERLNLMDEGGNFPLLFGVGRDGVGGTADDPDVDFGRDRFSLFEGFTGTEDTLARSVWGMSSRP